MEKPTPIIVSGSIAIDRIMSFTGRYREIIRPEKLESLSVSVLLDSLNDSDGGVGANIAYTLALLGDSPILLGSAGKDATAYLEKLAHAGVTITAVHTSDLHTATYTVFTDSEENQVAGFYPGAMSDSESLSIEPWKDQSPLMLVSPHDPAAMARQVRECQKWNIRLCYDVGQQVTSLPAADMKEGIKAASIVIVNEYEMGMLAARLETDADTIKKSVPVVITTFGKGGSVIEGSAVPEPLNIEIVKATQVVDPTGAGDCYRAGFLYGYSRGWDLRICGQLGATCATYAIEQTGTQNHSFSFKEVAERYQKNFTQALPPTQNATH
ncbi:MAG TPA: carbohydrate kinase family protein [Candidatus Saccharimonadia bacterium]